ncbi:hypothetical protein Tco_0641242, partial [Tanacetum coccineum]
MLEEALRLQEQLDEEERQRQPRLVYRLQAQERERYSEADKARLLVELINERANKRRNKPMNQAQQRTYISRSSKIDDEQELNQESSKRQKIGEGSEPAEESKDELSQEQLQQ